MALLLVRESKSRQRRFRSAGKETQTSKSRRFRSRWRYALVLSSLILPILLTLDAWRVQLPDPAPSYLLLDRNGRYLADVGRDPDSGYGYWPVSTLPSRVVAATLALEDKRFWQHPGVDPLAVLRAVIQNIKQGKRISGASTIAMQLARLDDPGPRSYRRKLREAWRALVMVWRFGHESVLAAYLRSVPYGNQVHGIGYAARRYLDKPAADLSWAEIAFLSAIPQAPSRMNPFSVAGRQRAITRARHILQLLHDSAIISDVDHAVAASQLGDLYIPEEEPRPSNSLHAVFRLQDLLPTLHHPGPEPYRLVTTLDRNLQDRLTVHASATLNTLAGRGAENAAVIVVETNNMAVRGWLGSVDYFDARAHGAIDYTRTPRSPGSTLKPFIYAAALDRGVITPASILDDLATGLGGTMNADRAFLGPLLPRQALANSRNVPAVALTRTVGIDNVYGLFHDLKLHDYEHPAQDYGLGLALGALPVTLEQLVSAYSVFVNGGHWTPLRWQTLPAAEETPLLLSSPRLSAGTARLVTLFLSDPSARLPTFPRMGATEYPFPVALKTGTSQGLRDAWTIAFSKRFLVGVWIGNADHRPMRDVTGGSAAAALAQRVLLDLHTEDRQGFADLHFAPPLNYVAARLCALTGKLASPGCDQVTTEWFPPQQVPLETDDTPFLLTAARQHFSRTGPAVRHNPMPQRGWINLPAKYAEWVSGPSAHRTIMASGKLAGNPAPNNPDPRIIVTAPGDGSRLLRDPTLPPNYNTIALRATVDPPTAQLLWLIDGQPVQLADFPYTIRWPLQAGTHTIQAELPNTARRSGLIHINVE